MASASRRPYHLGDTASGPLAWFVGSEESTGLPVLHLLPRRAADRELLEAVEREIERCWFTVRRARSVMVVVHELAEDRAETSSWRVL
jgi:hypothetical protein